jgi:hypothetical protein
MEKPRQTRSTARVVPLPPQPVSAVPAISPRRILLDEIRRQLGWSLIAAARK